MNMFIKVHAPDPFSEEDDAFNAIYVRPDNIAHVESFAGPFSLQAFGPDNRCVMTGKSRLVHGGLIILGVGGTRVTKETPEEIMELMIDSEKSF